MVFLLLLAIKLSNLDEITLRSGRKLGTDTPFLLEDPPDYGWFYIHLNKRSHVKKIELITNQTIPTTAFINQNWICIFLTQSQYNHLNSNFSSTKQLYITPNLPSDKTVGIELLSTEISEASINNNKLNNDLLGNQNEATPNDPKQSIEHKLSLEQKIILNNKEKNSGSNSYLIHAKGEYFHHANMTEYYTDYFISSQIPDLSDPSVLSVEPFNGPELLNRWAVGFVQSEEPILIYNGNSLTTNRPIHERGIRGDNVIITLIDSGIDTRLCYFRDKNRNIPFNQDDLDHRKIVRYEVLADAKDSNAGHGTHVVGTLAGNADCENCSAALYNGHAPNSKIYMVDAGLANDPSSLIPNIDYKKILAKTRQFHSNIMSNSWGFPPKKIGFRHMFDTIAYENPDILMLFGAGNTRKMSDMYTPANSKNCLAIGGTSNSNLADLEKDSGEHYVIVMRQNGQKKQYKIVPALWSESVFGLLKTDPIPSFRNLKVSLNARQNSTGNVLVIRNTDCQTIEDAQKMNYRLVLLSVSSYSNISSQIVCYRGVLIPVFYVLDTITDSLRTNQLISIDISVRGNSNYIISNFNSGGPSDLGLLKPDLMAPGDDIRSAHSSSGEVKSCKASSVLRKYGTSMAVPAVSAAAAMIFQYFRDGFFPYFLQPSAALMKAMLITSAGPRGAQPNLHSGYGAIHLDTVLAFPESKFRLLIAEAVPITEETMLFSTFHVDQKETPLCVTISWDDPPISIDSEVPVFADLDLILISPTKILYKVDDNRATSKRIYVSFAEKGQYEVRVVCPLLYKENMIIKFSIVVTGGFKKSNFLEFNQHQNIKRMECDPEFTGHLCEQKVIIAPNQGFIYPRKYLHFMVPLSALLIRSNNNKSMVLSVNVKIEDFQKSLVQIEISYGQVSRFGGKLLHFEKIKQMQSQFDINMSTLHFYSNRANHIIYLSLFETTELTHRIFVNATVREIKFTAGLIPTLIRNYDYIPAKINYSKIKRHNDYKPAPSVRPMPTPDYYANVLFAEIRQDYLYIIGIILISVGMLGIACGAIGKPAEANANIGIEVGTKFKLNIERKSKMIYLGDISEDGFEYSNVIFEQVYSEDEA